MYGTKPKRQITYVQKAPSIAHRWGADLRQRREFQDRVASRKREIEQAKDQRDRYREYLELCSTIVRCRTGRGTVGIVYPELREKLQRWVANYPTTQKEVEGIKRCLVTHSIVHL